VFHEGRAFTLLFGDHCDVVGVVQEDGERVPSALVYWCASEPIDGELPSDAVLLGALGERERHFRLPARDVRGEIVVFSLALGEIVAVLPLAAPED